MSSGDMSTTLRLQTTGDDSAIKQTIASLDQLTASMKQQTQVLEYLRQAHGSLSTSVAQSNAEWVKASASSSEFAARMRNVQAQLDLTKAKQDQTNNSFDAFAKTMMSTIAQGAEFATGFLSVTTALNLMREGFDAVTGSIQMAIGQMEQFLQQSFQLSTEAQQMEYLWGYQYGGPQGGGPQIAAQLQSWIPNFAMNSPYTMMQIMGAVGPLSQLGLSFQGLQRYLPLISDLAATHTSIFGGGGMLPLPYAALAVMEATKGYSRRLLMELQIRPNELTPYGLKFVGDKESGQIANPEMFLPALEAYAKDKGYLGASAKMAHESVTGLYASLQDRQQSFMRRLMGEDIPDPNAGQLSADVLGLIKKGDIVGAMKAVGADIPSLKSYGVNFTRSGGVTDVGAFQDALEKFSEDKFYAGRKDTPEFREGTIFSVILKTMQDFSKWWDDHQSTFDKVSKFVADVGGTLLTVGRNSISSGLGGLWQGLSSTFNIGPWQTMGNDFMTWISDPKNQDILKNIGQWTGTTVGQAVNAVGPQLSQDLKDFISWISDPKNQKAIGDFANNLKGGVGGALKEMVDDLKLIKQTWSDISGLFATDDGKDPGPVKLIKDLANFTATLGGTILNWFKNLINLLDDVAQGFHLLGDALSGHADWKAIQDWEAKYFHDFMALATFNDVTINVTGNADLTPLITARTQYNQDHPAPNKHVPGAGPTTGYGYGLGSYNETQNNTFNIQGATSWDVQRLIDANAKKIGKDLNKASRTPGGLQYNTVGLF